MATATMRSRAAGQLACSPANVGVTQTMPSVSFQDNGGRRPDPRVYTCPECGHILRVSGLGCHRIYFELDEDRSVDPLMNGACPKCGPGLPGKNPAGSRS